MIESKIEKLSELIQSSMKGGKKDYALSLLNSIIDRLNIDELIINRNKAKYINIEFQQFDEFIAKCVFCLQAIGFDKTELTNYNDEALIFIAKNRHKLKQPFTVKYFNTLHQLINYYEWTNGKLPENLIDLKDAYTEIENNRESEL